MDVHDSEGYKRMSVHSGCVSADPHDNDDSLISVHHTDTEASAITQMGNHGDKTETLSSVNLCGAVTLQDVRKLLKEWITSTPGKVKKNLILYPLLGGAVVQR